MKKRTKRPTKKGAWFVRVRGSYIPCSLAGWLTYIPYVAYILGVWWYATNQQWDFLLGLFVIAPNWIAALVVMTYIASRKS